MSTQETKCEACCRQIQAWEQATRTPAWAGRAIAPSARNILLIAVHHGHMDVCILVDLDGRAEVSVHVRNEVREFALHVHIFTCHITRSSLMKKSISEYIFLCDHRHACINISGHQTKGITMGTPNRDSTWKL